MELTMIRAGRIVNTHGVRGEVKVLPEGVEPELLLDCPALYVDGAPIVNHFASPAELPASTPLSAALSRALKALGFRFVGPTTIYSFLQAAGLVDDHMVWCPWHTENRREGAPT